MSKGDFIVIRGVLNYAKVLGPAKPHTGLPKYDKGPFWSVDVSPDAKSMKLLEKYGLTTGGADGTGKLRTPSPKDKNRFGNDPYISLKVLENRSDGTKNTAPPVTDLQGKDWDNGNIGNGSIGDVKVKVVDYGRASEKGVYLQAIRVLKHVPYEVEAFEPLSEDDEFFGASNEIEPDIGTDSLESMRTPAPLIEGDLDDDVPF